MTPNHKTEVKTSSKNNSVAKQAEHLSIRRVLKVPSHFVYSTKVTKSKTEIATPIPNQTRQSKVRKFHNNCLLPETPLSCKTPMRTQGKSLSLVELSLNPKPLEMKRWVSKEQVDKTTLSVVEQDYFTLGPGLERQLAEKVCKALILLAWRGARAQCETMRKNEKKLENQVQSLNLQVLVLKDLLNSEKARTTVAVEDKTQLRTLLEDKTKTVCDLQLSVHTMETEKLKWERLQYELSEEINSLNQMIHSKKQVIEDLFEKCSQLENIILESRAKECQILTQLKVNECKLADQTDNVKVLKEKCAEDQLKINELTNINKNQSNSIEFKEKKINECITEIKKMGCEMNNLKNTNKVQNQNIADLKMEIIQGRYQIQEYETIIKNLKQTLSQSEDEKQSFRHNVSNVMLNLSNIALKCLPSPHL